MRENLYRGKRVDNGEWEYGFYIMYFRSIAHPYSYTDGDHYIQTIPHNMRFKVDPETVGQYAWLQNKNGKKMFEGDIVINKAKWGDNVGVIAFKNGRFVVDWKIYNKHSDKGIIARTDDLSPCDEVIGNIFDNPELL